MTGCIGKTWAHFQCIEGTRRLLDRQGKHQPVAPEPGDVASALGGYAAAQTAPGLPPGAPHGPLHPGQPSPLLPSLALPAMRGNALGLAASMLDLVL